MPALRPLSHLSLGAVRSGCLRMRAVTPVRLYATESVPTERVKEYTDFPSHDGDDRLAGDYPEFPVIFNQKRDPYVKYDDQQLRRNFGDPLHEDDDVLNMWSPDVHDYVSNGTAGRYIATFFGIIAGAGYLLSFIAPESPAVPRVYPSGLFTELGGASDFKQIYEVCCRIWNIFLRS
ncbi:uncharacterized protein V1518DRAFT_419985 [Limtongia smithiae]|uniref:uncharacterized protein n=1 Tax=Limtongia smithiae TaxID=1125753 RepID=UPI0034CF10D6